MKKALIIGGSSGLGLSIAGKLEKVGYEVTVTGRTNRLEELSFLSFYSLDLTTDAESFSSHVNRLVAAMGRLDILVYAAGFYQHKTTAELSDDDIKSMIQIGLQAPIQILRTILKSQEILPIFLPITSTSEWTPREYEPVYTAVKSGLAMYAKSVHLDSAVEKVLVAGPAGMKTLFWDGTDEDTSTMLDPDWVAEQIVTSLEKTFSYRHIKILREPPRVVVDENK